MRTLLALALVLAACSRSDRPADPAAHDAAPSLTHQTGPDPVVLRIPRGGGTARAYLYPRLDSAIWSSPAAIPAPDRLLAFDDNAGQVVLADMKGAPVRLDLRSGDVVATRKPKLIQVASVDGESVFGVTDSGTVTRFTPSGRWNYKAPLRVRDVLPQSDGSLLVAAERGTNAVLWHLWPPDTRIVDSAVVPAGAHARPVQAGDRVVLVRDSSISALRGRDLAASPAVDLDAPVRTVAATPSGDRLYVLVGGKAEVQVVDRYRQGHVDRITLPAEAIDLRMDPVGRYMLVRPAHGDSAWIVALGAQRVTGTVVTAWRSDLPLVAPDGRLALAVGNDVALVDAEVLKRGTMIRNGAKDFWAVIAWNGFRPRDASLDQPVHFDSGVPPAPDSTGMPNASDLSAVGDARVTNVPARTTPAPAAGTSTAAAPPASAPPTPSTTTSRGFFVSVASHNTEQSARDDAAKVIVDGLPAHVATAPSNGQIIYRVVLGPYGSRAEAQQAGMHSGRPFWIFEAGP